MACQRGFLMVGSMVEVSGKVFSFTSRILSRRVKAREGGGTSRLLPSDYVCWSGERSMGREIRKSRAGLREAAGDLHQREKEPLWGGSGNITSGGRSMPNQG